jgi:hypothetical protein
MLRMEHPSDTFGEAVTWVDNAGNLLEYEVASFLSILDCKVLDIDVSGSFCGAIGVDHFNGGLVIFANWCGSFLSKTELRKDRMKIFCNFSR